MLVLAVNDGVYVPLKTLPSSVTGVPVTAVRVTVKDRTLTFAFVKPVVNAPAAMTLLLTFVTMLYL